MLRVSPVNELIASLQNVQDPAPLFGGLWFEGEVACLFADSNVGKSIMAVQIAEKISEQQPVLYVDCELTNKQFQKRYSSQDGTTCHRFPDGLFRATIAPERIGSGNFEDSLLHDIEQAAFLCRCKVIILDNLTYACNTSEKGDAAGAFMMKLKSLQMRHEWSILVIAHTPKRDEKTAITANHLAGSKKLFNFFDSIFAIGKSREDDNFRYLKQLKVRSGEFKLTENHVAVYELEKCEDGNLKFLFRKFDNENHQLEDRSIGRVAAYYNDVITLHDEGVSYRDIALRCGISRSTAHRICAQHREAMRQIVGDNGDQFTENDNDEDTERLFSDNETGLDSFENDEEEDAIT